jgi:microcystin-dependent protein
MSYQVKFTDTTKTPLTVEDQTINSEKSLQFVGKNYAGYSQYIAENFLHLLENFAKSTAPGNPITGQLWFNTTTGSENQLKVYNGTNWVAAGNVKKATTAPTTSVLGDLWVDTDNQQLHLYNGSGWVLVGPEYSSGQTTGAKIELIIDTTEQTRPILTNFVNGSRVAIISDVDFIPKATITGFSVIKQGINLSTVNFNTSATGNKFWGAAEKADALVVGTATVAATNFLRADQASTTNYGFNVRNNAGVSIGGDLSLSIAIDNNSAVITNKISGSSIDFKLKGNTATETILRIDSSTNVGVYKTNPSERLDVSGNIRTDGKILVTGTDDATSLTTGSITTAGGASIAKLLRVGTGLNVTGSSTLENALPKTTNTYNLGSNAVRWSKIYGDEVVANTVTANVTGFLTGNISGTATALTSTTEFSLGDRLDGSGNVLQASDVVSSGINYNGSTASGKLVLTGVISSSFIANKTESTDSLATDEFIINRSGSLRRLSKTTFLRNVATMPTGSILPFAGIVVPTGYLICDGSEVLISSYPDLFAVLQYSYKALSLLTGSGTFALPDFRGRFPLGLDSMSNSSVGESADRVTDASADILGGTGGTSAISISRNNLPEHVHDLKSSAGEQFYAIAPRAGNPAPNSNAEASNGLTAVGQGQLMVDSGGVNMEDLASTTLNVPISITNHYQAIKYIIFTGRIA